MMYYSGVSGIFLKTRYIRFYPCGAGMSGVCTILWQCGHLSRTLMGVSGSSDMSKALFLQTGQDTVYSSGSSITVSVPVALGGTV
jgi:hypothetical protein